MVGMINHTDGVSEFRLHVPLFPNFSPEEWNWESFISTSLPMGKKSCSNICYGEELEKLHVTSEFLSLVALSAKLTLHPNL